jgi:hypothetical protein
MADAGVTKIYITQFARTKQTAQKLETLLNGRGIAVGEDSIPLTKELINNPEDRTALGTYAKAAVAKLRREAHGECVLIVGHDLTVPAIIEALGCKTRVEIKRDEFLHIFIVIPGVDGMSTAGLFHVPDYTILDPQASTYSGSSERGDASEAVRNAAENARKALVARWQLKEIESGPEKFTVRVEVDRTGALSQYLPAGEVSKGGKLRSTFTGTSERGDITEAVQRAIREALKSLPTDFVQWQLKGIASGPDWLTAMIEAGLPKVPGQSPEQEKANGNIFTGTSDRGDVGEAIGEAAREAKRALGRNTINLRIKSVTGRSGGFVNERKVIVTVEPVSNE